MKSSTIAALTLLLTVCPLHSHAGDRAVSEVAVLAIHVSDTNTHDAVFRFLTDVLRLPVEYGPEMLGERRYAAVYAGNMFIEPCGPFSKMQYPVKGFKALFFGLNCRSEKSPPGLAAHLRRLKIAYEKVDPTVFRIQDTALAEGIYFAIDSQTPDQSAKEKETTLASTMTANQRDGLGLQWVQEIWLAYAEPDDLRSWGKFAGSAEVGTRKIWKLNRNQTVRFVRSNTRGVHGIVFKVRSLEAAGKYLKERKCFGRLRDGKIELDRNAMCGLPVYFAENSGSD